jgi:hypothetical protein
MILQDLNASGNLVNYMSELYRKIINEALMAQHADVETVKRKRGQASPLRTPEPILMLSTR